jgi:hypothetical protein
VRLLAASLLLALCIPAFASAEEETVWLRGRGDDVWIERDGSARESREGGKAGFTRVVSSPLPEVRARDGEPADPRPRVAVIVVGEPGWVDTTPPYPPAHAYTPHVYYPRHSFRLHPDRRPYRHVHGLPFRGHPAFHGGHAGHRGAHRPGYRIDARPAYRPGPGIYGPAYPEGAQRDGGGSRGGRRGR